MGIEKNAVIFIVTWAGGGQICGCICFEWLWGMGDIKRWCSFIETWVAGDGRGRHNKAVFVLNGSVWRYNKVVFILSG